jgi:hypothetical protein
MRADMATGDGSRCELAVDKWRRVNALCVPCPFCGAAPGEPCRGYLGPEGRASHFARQLAAYEQRECPERKAEHPDGHGKETRNLTDNVLGQFRVSELAEYWIVSCKQCPQKWSVNRKTTGSLESAPARFTKDAGERAIVQMVAHADTHKPRVLHEVDDPPAREPTDR